MSARLRWASGMVAEFSRRTGRWRIADGGEASRELQASTLAFLEEHFSSRWRSGGPEYFPDLVAARAEAAAAELGALRVEVDPPPEVDLPDNAVFSPPTPREES